ncbi:MAG: PorV/PorQ family protein [Elusimicrobia bacterium]|nr:PorV/PorQ family protein [Elusimicrobiota bacterium]
MKNAAATLVALLSVLPLRAGGAGTSGVNFLKSGVGARSLAMAGAAVSTVDDANAIYWNPARLARINDTSVTATYASLFEDQSQGFLGAATPWGGLGVVGLGVNYLTVKDIEKRAGDTETADSTFKDQEYSASVSFARKGVLWDALDLGANAKMIHQSLDTYKENAYAVDLGATYLLTEKMTAGLTVQNLGSKLGSDSLPVLIKAGGDWRLFQDKLTVALDGSAWVTDSDTPETPELNFGWPNPGPSGRIPVRTGPRPSGRIVQTRRGRWGFSSALSPRLRLPPPETWAIPTASPSAQSLNSYTLSCSQGLFSGFPIPGRAPGHISMWTTKR